MQNKVRAIRVDFSLRREVFFVVIGAIVGALIMIIPKTILEVGIGLPYYLTWIAFGHIVGIYSPASIIVGITIHILTAISIGTIVGEKASEGVNFMSWTCPAGHCRSVLDGIKFPPSFDPRLMHFVNIKLRRNDSTSRSNRSASSESRKYVG